MAVYGYCRVSSTKQLEGESLAQQDRQIRGYAAMKGLEVTRMFHEEGVSASVPLAVRPSTAGLMISLQPGDVLIAAKLDRLFRSALDTLRSVDFFKEKCVELHLLDLGGEVTGGGISKLLLTVTAGFAEMERDRIKERVLQTKAFNKSRGRFTGGTVPFGYTVDEGGFLVAEPWRARVVDLMTRCHAAGDSYRRISAECARMGVRISHAGIKGMFERGDLLPGGSVGKYREAGDLEPVQGHVPRTKRTKVAVLAARRARASEIAESIRAQREERSGGGDATCVSGRF